MNDVEIEKICKKSIECSTLLCKHPLEVIDNLLPFFIKPDEFKAIRHQCHEWLFNHRGEIPLNITNPNEDG